MCKSLFLVLLGVFAVSACEGSYSAPILTAPGPGPTIIVGASSNANPIAIGETVTGVVKLSDPFCVADPIEPGDPCQRFAVTPSESGTLRVQVTSPGPGWLTLRVASEVGSYGTTSVSSVVDVVAGSTYEVSVALHAPAVGDTSQAFELSTALADGSQLVCIAKADDGHCDTAR
jgi:hypothetical protein